MFVVLGVGWRLNGSLVSNVVLWKIKCSWPFLSPIYRSFPGFWMVFSMCFSFVKWSCHFLFGLILQVHVFCSGWSTDFRIRYVAWLIPNLQALKYFISFEFPEKSGFYTLWFYRSRKVLRVVRPCGWTGSPSCVAQKDFRTASRPGSGNRGAQLPLLTQWSAIESDRCLATQQICKLIGKFSLGPEKLQETMFG